MLDTTLSGANLIDGRFSRDGTETLRAENRIDGHSMEPAFAVATEGEVDRACAAAARDFDAFAALSPEETASFLDEIALQIEALGDALIDRANLETGLPKARLTGERARTCGQLRMFAALLREGSWVDARIDHAIADRTPPKPDIRRMLVPLGPVAVFGASNFPLAFSVAGGDTASALAAGCPVVVKAHPSHPGTSEHVASAILAAIRRMNLPTGIFAMLHGGAEVGRQLVRHPAIEAVGFTGSQTAGRALFDLASSRERPIPVYAEMGSVNPLFVLPGALSERMEAIAQGYAESLMLGVGQFCTNPGVLVGIGGEEFHGLVDSISERLSQSAPGTMLNSAIAERYEAGLRARSRDERLSTRCSFHQAVLFEVDGKRFLESRDLAEELFGPAAIAVRCEDESQMFEVARSLKGQLTATVLHAESDMARMGPLLRVLASVAGRVIANGYPTGVEVCPSMQHGGPYPATTDARSTSVGTAAIFRFVRPVAYQGMPDALLPKALQEANPLGIRRLVDGQSAK